ncbi:MAG TPA: ankyrin repeat domain-containing protein, partial [Gammaproteobacteria bacterium]|nr:ankyrin repeat domain-containing protein [Gammaproteobacteria bacterium]
SKLKQTFNDKDLEIVCYYAVLSNETKIAKPLITKDILKNNGPFCVNTGLRPLHVAVNKKNFTLVKAILEHKANPDCKTELTETNKKEITPLQLAIQSNQPEMIKILLDANADVNLIMDNKESPAAYAAELEFWDCVTELIYHPKCQLTQEELAKLLCHAVGQNQTSMVELLLDKKAPPQKRYFIFSGYFPLHRAVEHNNIAMVNDLLEKKADLLLKTKALDRKQETCLDIALQKGHPEMINFLLEKGELKKQKMDECFADILSYRAAFAAMTRCLSEFKISQTNVLSYIEQKKDHPNYFLLLLSSFLYLSNNKTSPVDCLFEDIKYEGQIYIAEALLEIFINAAESHHEYYQTLPEVCRKICTPKVLDIKNNQAQFGAVDLTNLFLFKNSNIKIVKSKKENLHSFTQNKTLIHRVAIVNDIRDRIRLNTYDPIHIESQLKLTYGEDIFYTSFFNRNPLLTYVRQLSIAFKKLDSKSIRKDAIRPPEYNPEYPLDEPGAINHNAYFNMNLFPANPNEIEGKEEEQIEGQPNLK